MGGYFSRKMVEDEHILLPLISEESDVSTEYLQTTLVHIVLCQ